MMQHDFTRPHATCPTCMGCDQEGCSGECHGNPFGDHGQATADPELARLLAEEDALETEAAWREREMAEALQVSPEERIELTIARLKVDFGTGGMTDSVTTRVRRLLQNDRYVNDAGYWMMNYAQACEGRLSVERSLDTARKALAEAEIKLAARTLRDMEDAYEEEWG